MESSQEPRAAWYQGLLGELCHYKDGTFNMLEHGPRAVPGVERRQKMGDFWSGPAGAPQPLRASFMAPWLLLSVERSLQSSIIL